MSISLSFNPLSIVEYFRSKGNRNHDQVATYLDEMAAEAKALAEVWDSVIKDLTLREGRFDVTKHKDILLRMRVYEEPNAPYFARLMEFYRSISAAVAGKLEAERLDSVVMHLGLLLHERQVTLKKYQSSLDTLGDAFLLSEDNRISDFQNLSTLSLALHREAAALDVLAKTIRVQMG